MEVDASDKVLVRCGGSARMWRRTKRAANSCCLIAFFTIALLAIVARASGDEPHSFRVVPQIGHIGSIGSVSISPDGHRALSAGDKTVKLWDLETGALIRTLEGHERGVTSVDLSPDGRRALLGNVDEKLKLWDLETGELIRILRGHESVLSSVAFSPDGRRALSGSWDKTVKFWDLETGVLIRTLEGHRGVVYSVAFSPDGRRALSGSEDGTLKLWDLETGALTRTLEGHENVVYSVDFSPDGRRAISGGRDKTLKLWDLETGMMIRSLEGHQGPVLSVTFSPEGRRALTGDEKTLRLWDLETGTLIETLEDHQAAVFSADFLPDGRRALSGSSDKTLKLWDLENGTLIRAFEGHQGSVFSVDFSPDGHRALSGDEQTLRLWDLENGKLIRVLKGHWTDVNSVDFSPDGRRALSGSSDKTLKLWDLENGTLIRTLEGHKRDVVSVAFLPDGRRALSGSWDETLKLWNLETGELIRTLEGHENWVFSVAVSPDGRRALSASWDGTLKLWDLETGALIRTLHHGFNERGVSSVAFLPDGRRALSGATETLKLWNLETGALIRTLKGHKSAGVYSVAFSPDGHHGFSGSMDGTLKLWNLETGALIQTLEGHESGVYSAALSPDGFRALSGGEHGTTRIWNVLTGKEMAQLIGSSDGEWVAMTPEGFFSGSENGDELLAIVQGLEVHSLGQFYDHLRRPDLLEEALKGDPEGKVKDAAYHLDLDKILASGPAPTIELLDDRTEHPGVSIRLSVRLKEQGGGIGGKLLWRVNGQTQGDVRPAALKGRATPNIGQKAIVTQTLQLLPDVENVIEVTAYNGRELIATPPLRILADARGVTTEPRARMHILALGVNNYRMKDYMLEYAASDAEDLATALTTVGSALFANIEPKILTNEQVTRDAIAAAFNEIAAESNPRDVFVLYVAGHGKSIAGRYYYYPQSIDFAAGQSVETHGIGQDQWQEWLAGIPAQKTLLIFDTCESAATTGLFRGSTAVLRTAIDQLQHATGRNVIAAARQAAYEGYRGHGVMTGAILEAMSTDIDDDPEVTIGQVADYVDERVPALTASLFGVRQEPVRELAGNNFPLGFRQALNDHEEGIPTTPDYVVIRRVPLRQQPNEDAISNRDLVPGTQVYVVQVYGEWSLVAREGQKIGYVPVDDLAPLH